MLHENSDVSTVTEFACSYFFPDYKNLALPKEPIFPIISAGFTFEIIHILILLYEHCPTLFYGTSWTYLVI